MSDFLRIDTQSLTLVDQVEDKILNYLKANNLKTGDAIPGEVELAASLGVARSVLREALSRLKMMGLIESRSRRGMIITEPKIWNGIKRVIDPRILGEEALYDLLGFRIALEIGICGEIINNLTDKDLQELEDIVSMEVALSNNVYGNYSEYAFHAKLYSISGNKSVQQFQDIINPVINFVKTNLREQMEEINVELGNQGRLVTHRDLLNLMKERRASEFREAMEQHFYVYRQLIHNKLSINKE